MSNITERYQYFLFDWDGCLAQTLNLWVESYETVLKEYGLVRTRQYILEYLGDANALKKLGVEDVEYATSRLTQLIDIGYTNVTLYPHAQALLLQLKRHDKQLALVTSTERKSMNIALDTTQLNDIFDVIVTGDMVERAKPDPEPLNAAIHKLGADKESTIMVGDSSYDITAAKATDIDSLLFLPKSHEVFYNLEKLKQAGPTHTIADFAELLA